MRKEMRHGHAPLDLEKLETLRAILRRLDALVFANFDEVAGLLDRGCDTLAAMGKINAEPPSDFVDDCPWTRCNDGSCRPSCNA